MRTVASDKLHFWIGAGEGDTASTRVLDLAVIEAAIWVAMLDAMPTAHLFETKTGLSTATRPAAPKVVVRLVSNGA